MLVAGAPVTRRPRDQFGATIQLRRNAFTLERRRSLTAETASAVRRYLISAPSACSAVKQYSATSALN